MTYSQDEAVAILRRTPDVLESLFSGLPECWTASDSNKEAWAPFDIVGHLIHGEKTDWIERMNIVLSSAPDKTFTPFDRLAQFDASRGKTLPELLAEFRRLREKNIATLTARRFTQEDLKKTGIHPALGTVTLSQLLSTWVVHDLNHLAQITRVMAGKYREEVGPWVEYLRILKE